MAIRYDILENKMSKLSNQSTDWQITIFANRVNPYNEISSYIR